MAKQVVLDGIGVIMAGYHEPLGLGRIVVDYTRMVGGAAQATVVDGSEHSETVQRLSGWCGIPLTREQRMQKFLGCSRRLLSPETAHGMAKEIDRLETLPDIRNIMAPLRAP